jgi:hypothetical protein
VARRPRRHVVDVLSQELAHQPGRLTVLFEKTRPSLSQPDFGVVR